MSVRKRGKRAFQVRVAPYPAKTLPTREAAEKYELELRLRRSQGDRYLEPSRTLGEELDAWLARQRATGGLRVAPPSGSMGGPPRSGPPSGASSWPTLGELPSKTSSLRERRSIRARLSTSFNC
jgi:hypothetical protein